MQQIITDIQSVCIWPFTGC